MASLRILTALLFLSTLPSYARITRIEVQRTLPESTRGVPATYRVIQGLAYGEVDPTDPHNTIIQDIALAPRNSRGAVEYTATFTLYAPIHPTPNAILLYEVVNRGGPLLPRDYTSNDFFLLSGWQADIPFEGHTASGAHAETIRVPVARNPDGTPVTGPAVARFIDQQAGQKVLTLARSITYGSNDLPPTPLDLDPTHAHLIIKQYEDIDGAEAGVTELPPTAWSWGDCTTPNPTQICLKSGADPALLYELRFTAKDPLILGLGPAAVRDLNAFLLASPAQPGSFQNPVQGHVKAAIALGVSQSGNFLRSFLNLGFNQDESNHIVFSGVMPIISARQVPLNVRFGVPGGASNLYELGTDGASWWSPTPDPVRHQPTSGQIDRCAATHTCPKIIELLGSAEFYALRASLDFTGTSADHDLPLPANVRRFYIPGTTHGGGSGGFALASHPVQNCTLATNPNPEDPIRRALFQALRQWVLDDTAPPESIYPTLKSGTLAPAATVLATFPRIPGQPLPRSALNPNLIYDLGPNFHANHLSGAPISQPPAILGTAPSVLPTLDADGNEIGGVRTPLLQSPLGTYTGWNVVTSGFRKGQFCSFNGGYIPFAPTAAIRAATHDPRPSIAERYPTHAAYVDRIRASTNDLVAHRLLLPDDAAKIIQQAEQSEIPH